MCGILRTKTFFVQSLHSVRYDVPACQQMYFHMHPARADIITRHQRPWLVVWNTSLCNILVPIQINLK